VPFLDHPVDKTVFRACRKCTERIVSWHAGRLCVRG